MSAARLKKEKYFERMFEILNTYNKFFLVDIDNVGSQQMNQARVLMRGKAEILMGKNTLMKKCINTFLESNPGHPIEQILDKLVLNVGFVFTNEDLGDIRAVIDECAKPAPARAGSIAPIDVIVPAGPTGAGPEQTGFFQALQIPTKIMKGQIEMLSDTHLIHAGDKVTPGQASLLEKLETKPFTYNMVIKEVYDNGDMYPVAVLDMTDDVLEGYFYEGLRNVASISLALDIPTAASLPHLFATAVKDLIAISLESGAKIDIAQPYRDALKLDAPPPAEKPAEEEKPAEAAADAAAY